MKKIIISILLSICLSSQLMASEKPLFNEKEYQKLKSTVELLMNEHNDKTKNSRSTKHQSINMMNRLSGNRFNPAISLILNSYYTDIDNSTLSLPGFQLGGEAGLPDNGFSTGHNELTMSANVDDKFYGFMTTAIVRKEHETTIELEESYIETLGLDHGLTLKGGQFFSGIGYLNTVHDHAHDFSDRPLVYDALFGGHLLETGMQASWIAPAPVYLNLGAELLSGKQYPSGDNTDGKDGLALFAKTGGDIGLGGSWQLGASYYEADFDKREAGGHHHGEEAAATDNELLNGNVTVSGIDAVYKWSPKGNSKSTNFKLQAEYFIRDEKGSAEFTEGADSATANYDGEQSGFYAQAIYQFMPSWRVGVRHEQLKANNNITDFFDSGIAQQEFLDESGLGTAGDPKRQSVMIDYSPSHFSRIRLQYSDLDDGEDNKNDLFMLQYIMSLGSHGAHKF